MLDWLLKSQLGILFTTGGIYVSIYTAVFCYSVCRALCKNEQNQSMISTLFNELKRNKNTYLAVALHIFDQATDYQACVAYYREIPRDNSKDDVNVIWWYFMSVLILVCHRSISTAAIWWCTHNKTNTFLQLLDLAMVRAVIEGQFANRSEPGNVERFLQAMEAIFESFPQLVLSVVYLLRTGKANVAIIIQALFSVFTLSLRVCNDDQMFFPEEFSVLFSKLWFCRVFIFRLPEIFQRVAVISLFWALIDGFWLVYPVFFGFLFCKAISYVLGSNLDIYLNSPEFYTYLLYFKPGTDHYCVWLFVRPILHCGYLMTAIYFSPGRRRHIILSPFGMTLIVFCFLTTFAPCLFAIIIKSTPVSNQPESAEEAVKKYGLAELFSKRASQRNLRSAVLYQRWDIVCELVEFGADPKYVLEFIGDCKGVSKLLIYGCQPMMKYLLNLDNDRCCNIFCSVDIGRETQMHILIARVIHGAQTGEFNDEREYNGQQWESAQEWVGLGIVQMIQDGKYEDEFPINLDYIHDSHLNVLLHWLQKFNSTNRFIRNFINRGSLSN